MERKDFEIALIQYNKKTWCKSAVLGFFIGLAVIVPGISGSTVAIIFKLYNQFLYALGNLFKQFKKCFTFLLPIGLGLIIGVVMGFIAVKQLLDLIPFAIVGLFAGLMCGAFPAVKDELKGAEMNAKRNILFIIGLLVPVAIGCFSAISTVNAPTVGADAFESIKWYHPVIAVIVGATCGLTQIVPGLSASAILMAVGWFQSLVGSVSATYWSANPTIFFVYIGLAIGFVGAVLAFSKLLTVLFAKARHTAYSLIVGLSLGSILSMFCNGDIVGVYLGWADGLRTGEIVDIVLGVLLFAVGVVGAYLLVKYQRKKDAENETL